MYFKIFYTTFTLLALIACTDIRYEKDICDAYHVSIEYLYNDQLKVHDGVTFTILSRTITIKESDKTFLQVRANESLSNVTVLNGCRISEERLKASALKRVFIEEQSESNLDLDGYFLTLSKPVKFLDSDYIYIKFFIESKEGSYCRGGFLELRAPVNGQDRFLVSKMYVNTMC